MKASIKFLALLLLTLSLSGCATGQCKKNAVETPAPVSADVSEKVAVPVAPKVVAKPAVATPALEPVADEVPVATRKYVSN